MEKRKTESHETSRRKNMKSKPKLFVTIKCVMIMPTNNLPFLYVVRLDSLK